MNFSWKEVEVNSGKDSIEVNQLDEALTLLEESLQ
jgi:hypothetical protein